MRTLTSTLVSVLGIISLALTSTPAGAQGRLSVGGLSGAVFAPADGVSHKRGLGPVRLFTSLCSVHVHPYSPEETMADEPRDQRPTIRLSQLSHGAG